MIYPVTEIAVDLTAMRERIPPLPEDEDRKFTGEGLFWFSM